MESGLRKLRPPLRLGLVILGIVAALAAGPRMLRPTRANPSDLLHDAKNNPDTAEQLCQKFKAINGSGDSVYSSRGLQQVASSRKITTGDAEILVTYVVGIYCPDVT